MSEDDHVAGEDVLGAQAADGREAAGVRAGLAVAAAGRRGGGGGKAVSSMADHELL